MKLHSTSAVKPVSQPRHRRRGREPHIKPGKDSLQTLAPEALQHRMILPRTDSTRPFFPHIIVRFTSDAQHNLVLDGHPESRTEQCYKVLDCVRGKGDTEWTVIISYNRKRTPFPASHFEEVRQASIL